VAVSIVTPDRQRHQGVPRQTVRERLHPEAVGLVVLPRGPDGRPGLLVAYDVGEKPSVSVKEVHDGLLAYDRAEKRHPRHARHSVSVLVSP